LAIAAIFPIYHGSKYLTYPERITRQQLQLFLIYLRKSELGLLVVKSNSGIELSSDVLTCLAILSNQV